MQPNGHAAVDSPIDYPKIVIGGKMYTVKFTNRAIYRLSKQGVDLAQFGRDLREQRLNLAMIYDLLAAMIQEKQFAAEDLAEAFPDVAEASRVIVEAMGKAPRPETTPVEIRETPPALPS